MSNTTDTAAPTADKDAKEKGPSPILRGVSKGETTVCLWGHGPEAKTHMHGFVNLGGKNTQVIGFFNDKDGKKSITLKEADGDGWKVLGYGHAVNSRSDGDAVYFDTVLFNVGDKTIGARVTRAGEAFHDKMGFTSPKQARPVAEKAAAETAADAGEAGDAAGESASEERPRMRA